MKILISRVLNFARKEGFLSEKEKKTLKINHDLYMYTPGRRSPSLSLSASQEGGSIVLATRNRI